MTFLAVSQSKLYEPALSNVIPYPRYTYFSLSLYFTILVAPKETIPKFEIISIISCPSI